MDVEDRLADILGAWQERRDRGETVDPEDVIRDHPELADRLRARFAALAAVDEVFDEAKGLASGAPGAIGEYRLLREIGRGGMGVVYEAEQTSMERRVALKVLSASFATTPQAVKRFEREAKAAGRLHHTNIVPVYGMGRARGRFFYSMELVHGRSLGEIIAEMRGPDAPPLEESLGAASSEAPDAGREGRPPVTTQTGTASGNHAYFVRLSRMFAAVADALKTAHQAGVIHRDVKPGNLLLDTDGVLKLVDFGLARYDDESLSLTMTGDLLGTPNYMSPEQAMAKRVKLDHRTDIYSLGATLYEVLTLSPPFRARSLQELCSHIITKDPVLPRRRNRRIPRDLETVVLKAMEKDRDRRYASAEEMASDLRRFAEGAAIRARRIGPAGRAWRKVKRHKVRSALVAGLLVLAAAGSILGAWALREAARRTDLEYARHVAHGHEALLRYRWAWSELEPRVAGEAWPSELFGRAIDLLPDRPEAYLGRALSPEWPDGLADLDAARARGLSERTYRLARAHLLRLLGRPDDASVEERRAEALPRTDPAEALFEGRLRAAQCREPEALSLLAEAIEGSDRDSSVRYLAHHARARVRSRAGALPGAVEDLVALRTAGDTSLATTVLIAELWRRMGFTEKATEEWERALADVREADSEPAWFALGLACAEVAVEDWADLATAEGARRHPDSGRLLALRADHASALEPEERLALLEQAVTLEPGSLFVRTELGLLLMRQGRHESALEAFEESERLDPAHPAPLVNQGLALHELERNEEALDVLRRATARHPGSVGALTNLANVLRASGRHAEALAACERAIEIDPLSVWAHYNRALVHKAAGCREEALDDLARVLELDVTGSHPRRAKAHGIRGRLLVELGRPVEGVEEYERALAREPPAAGAYVDYGDALRACGRNEEAAAAFRRATELEPDLALAHYDLGIVLRDLEKPEAARDALRRALDLEAERPQLGETRAQAHLQLGYALRSLHRFEEALVEITHAAAIDPDLYEAHSWSAFLYSRLARLEDAVRAARRAIDLRSEDHGPHCVLTRALLHLDRIDEGFDASAEALRTDPRCSSSQEVHGDLLVRRERFDEAAEAYGRSAAIAPDADLFRKRAGALHRARRWDEAVKAYDEAIRLGPGDWTDHHLRSLALQSLVRHVEAKRSLEKAVDLAGDHPAPRNALAWLLATCPDPALQDADRAVALARKAVAAAPEAGDSWNTLGVALYRQGDDRGAGQALRRSVELRGGGDAVDHLFLAMAAHRLGESDEARRHYDVAVEWLRKHPAAAESLARFRVEAARLLGTE